MRVYLLLTILLFGLVPSTGAEEAIFFDRSREGWFWFKELIKPPLKERPNAHGMMLPPTIKEMRERAEGLLSRAIEEPIEENLLAYMAYQRLLTRRAEEFAGIWQRMLWQHPELDPTVEEPVASVGLTAARAEQIRERDEGLYELAQTSGLLYFYSGNCPLCEVQSPLLARFAEVYGFRIIPISLDGTQDPLFPEAKVDRGAAARLGVEQVPALFLARPPAKILRVGTGLIALEELAMRLYRLSHDLKKEDERSHENVISVSDNYNALPATVQLPGDGGLTAAAR